MAVMTCQACSRPEAQPILYVVPSPMQRPFLTCTPAYAREPMRVCAYCRPRPRRFVGMTFEEARAMLRRKYSES